jgi:hypothetical protein
MLAQQGIADVRPAAWLLKSYNDEIGQRRLHFLGDFRFVGNFADNLDIGLIREGREDDVSHEARMVGHENTNRFFHGILRDGGVWGLPEAEVSTKKTPIWSS